MGHSHTASTLENTPERLRAGRIALVVSSVLFLGKIVAYGMTQSSAVLSDAMESVVHVVASGLVLYSLFVASRPADRGHPYGHGKIEFFSAGVEGTMIAVAAGVILVTAIREMIVGPRIHHLDQGLILLGLVGAVNGALGIYLVRVGRRTQSFALIADGEHMLADVKTTVGVLVGLFAVRVTGWVMLDPLVAIAMAAHILTTGSKLLGKAFKGLMDASDPKALQAMNDELEKHRQPWWIDAHSLRAWRSGHVLHVDLHLSVPRYFDAERLHDVDEEIEQVLLSATESLGDVIVHFDPCRPRQCMECVMEDCPVRSNKLESRPAFRVENITRGDEELDTGAPVTDSPPTEHVS